MQVLFHIIFYIFPQTFPQLNHHIFFCTNPTVYIEHTSPLLNIVQIICRVFHTCAKLFSVSLLFSLIHQSHSSFILFCYSYFLFHNNRTLLFAKNTFYFKIYYLIKPLAKISNTKNRTNFPSSFFILHPKNRTSTHIISVNPISIHIVSVSFVKTTSPTKKQCTKKEA